MICGFEDCDKVCDEDYPIEDSETLKTIYVCEDCNLKLFGCEVCNG